ncbi:uncharacterized protein B0P05DRAFT_583398 [Gilbertella persicaria]|uniref:uncharacterized protein n=1 Tax=Gilbertella persicaria TaxID=101096 RepID=UPI00221F430F|nr:uncharacterized protein B0P05DRAFT_583398 [Gilbertella persicaria]KAI8092135.1 hypothetical protein B0P05DRAFT_583398 [Gilbertella persicaria]
MNNDALNYQVPEISTVKCSSYFKSTPLGKWSVHGYAQHAQLKNSSVRKFGKSSEQFRNEIENIKKSEETPSDVKRVLNSILPKKQLLSMCPSNENSELSTVTQVRKPTTSDKGKERAESMFNSATQNEAMSSNRSENTAVQSKISVLNKGKRKANEIEENSELQISVPPDDSDALDSLFKNPLSTPVASLPPFEFRRLVYIYGSKALSKTFYMEDAFALENLIREFSPTTLGEQLDGMSAKLAMTIDLSNIIQVNALKLSLLSETRQTEEYFIGKMSLSIG